MDRRVANIQGVIDADTRNLLALKVAGSNDGALIDLSGLSAVTSVAGVGPVAKDIPLAALQTALGIPAVVGTVKKVAGLDPDGAGAISAANLNAALATILTIAGLTPSGAGAITKANLNAALTTVLSIGALTPDGAGNITIANLISALVAGNLATSLAAEQTLTWVQAQTFTGTFDGQRVKVPALDGLGGWVFMVWNATAGRLEPEGMQCLGSYPKQTGNTGTGAQGFPVALPTMAFTGGPFWVGTKIEVFTKISDTVNGDTAAPVNMSWGTMQLIGDTQATSRRKSFHRVIDIQAAAVQFCHSKLDNAYSAFSGDNSAPLAGTQNTATGQTWNLTLDVSTGWNNASSHTPTMEEHAVFWRR